MIPRGFTGSVPRLHRFWTPVLAVWLAGCASKSPVQPSTPTYWLTGQVTDAADQPVAAAPVSIVYEFQGSSEPCPLNRTAAVITIHLDLEEPTFVRLTISDYLHRTLVTLVDGELPPGRQVVVWNGLDSQGRRCPGGVYYYNVFGREPDREWEAERKMLLLYCSPEERAVAPHAMTDAEGRYRIEMGLLPIAEHFELVDDTGHGRGVTTITNQVLVEVASIEGKIVRSQAVEVRIDDRNRDLQVDLQLP